MWKIATKGKSEEKEKQYFFERGAEREDDLISTYIHR